MSQLWSLRCPAHQIKEQAGGAYATPTIVHFATVRLLSAALTAPWRDVRKVAVFCGLLGLGGLVYATIVARRLRVQTVYLPAFEDSLFHALLPFAAYLTLAASACVARAHAHEGGFGVAAAVLLLPFIVIHNSWDAVTYHVFVKDLGQPARPPRERN